MKKVQIKIMEKNFLKRKVLICLFAFIFLNNIDAEEINFGEISTGASNDFEQATKIARAMVTEYGMSDLGPIQYEQQSGSVFLGRD